MEENDVLKKWIKLTEKLSPNNKLNYRDAVKHRPELVGGGGICVGHFGIMESRTIEGRQKAVNDLLTPRFVKGIIKSVSALVDCSQ
ncbi:hypothetical protein H0G72_01190 [Liberibacter sp. Z1]|nr:hypothetical protein [Candidatus Liberibacter sp.]